MRNSSSKLLKQRKTSAFEMKIVNLQIFRKLPVVFQASLKFKSIMLSGTEFVSFFFRKIRVEKFTISSNSSCLTIGQVTFFDLIKIKISRPQVIFQHIQRLSAANCMNF